MTTEKLNTEFINLIKEKLPVSANLANTLMDILFLGKEAIYRRLRGEVPFTLAEAAAVSRKLGVSLDELIGSSFQGNALFNLNFIQQDDLIKTYSSIVDTYVNLFRNVKEEPNSCLYSSSNLIPQTSYLKYDMLSKFRLFKWVYQHNNQAEFIRCFDDTDMPKHLLDSQKAFVEESQGFSRTCYIWDDRIFYYLANDIRYFIEIGLISKGNATKLKDEILALLDELETIAEQGRFKTGKKVEIYISNINFEATYSYVASDYFNICLVRLFAINSITSQDPKVVKSIKEWILSLKKFSTLISQSGEMQRIQFFAKQRELIKSL